MERTKEGSTTSAQAMTPAATSLIVCSLEEWGTVRRRMRIMVDELVEADPGLQVLYVGPAVDVPHAVVHGGRSDVWGHRTEQVHPRIRVLRPYKWLPRVIGPFADRSLGRQVQAASDRIGLVDPLLWINDASYAQFAVASGRPVLYDVTDDWLLAPLAPRQRRRLEEDDALLVARSDAVVVCSPDLARTRGKHRSVDLIPNGVDVDLFRTPQARPADLHPGPVAVYVGTLHEERIDVPLILELAASRPDLRIVLIGPSSLSTEHEAALRSVGQIQLMGPRPYHLVPAYLQHADVVIVPHVVSPFTESLDPIKAYECAAAGRPTVATPVAGFRELGPPIVVADAASFSGAVSALLAAEPNEPAAPGAHVASWHDRAQAMSDVMTRIRTQGAR
jgi:glycosyltransferase involved in cell wall biosynthesis